MGEKVVTDLPFDAWVRWLFCQPGEEPAWHWDVFADRVELEPAQVVAYTTMLFEGAGALLAAFQDSQVNHGLWFLINEGGPLRALADNSVALGRRVDCIRSMTTLFEQCFMPRCTPHLSHLSEPGAGPLNPVCYMWWDIFPLCPEPDDPARREIDAACLSVMATTLQLPSIPCQESALHGLGHWGFAYEARCQNIISTFLHRNADMRAVLRDYALRAREKNVN